MLRPVAKYASDANTPTAISSGRKYQKLPPNHPLHKNKGRCQLAQITPTSSVDQVLPLRLGSRGSRYPLHPNSSSSGPPSIFGHTANSGVRNPSEISLCPGAIQIMYGITTNAAIVSIGPVNKLTQLRSRFVGRNLLGIAHRPVSYRTARKLAINGPTVPSEPKNGRYA